MKRKSNFRNEEKEKKKMENEIKENVYCLRNDERNIKISFLLTSKISHNEYKCDRSKG